MFEFINGVPMKNDEVVVRIVDLWLLRGTLIKARNNKIADLLMQNRHDGITAREALLEIEKLKYDLEQYEQFFKKVSEITMDDVTSYEKKELW